MKILRNREILLHVGWAAGWTVVALLALAILSGCAHIEPVPCSDLTSDLPRVERAYARLCV